MPFSRPHPPSDFALTLQPHGLENMLIFPVPTRTCLFICQRLVPSEPRCRLNLCDHVGEEVVTAVCVLKGGMKTYMRRRGCPIISCSNLL